MSETWAPVYQVNSINPNPANFDDTLAADAALACELTGEVVFDYGPPFWRVGETDIKQAFADGGNSAQAAARDFVERVPRFVIPEGTSLFRIRKNPVCDETITTAAAFDPPPDNVSRSPGRWDDGVTPVLYASDDIELCLHECRVVIADEIVVATLTTQRPLILLDLPAKISLENGSPFEDPNNFASFMSMTRQEDWQGYTRIVSHAARAAGLDGIRYQSYYSQAKHTRTALNVALFGRPIAAGALEIQSVNRIQLSDAQYKYDFGPVLYRDSVSEAALQAYLDSALSDYGRDEPA